jgi:hypothetical protein
VECLSVRGEQRFIDSSTRFCFEDVEDGAKKDTWCHVAEYLQAETTEAGQ